METLHDMNEALDYLKTNLSNEDLDITMDYIHDMGILGKGGVYELFQRKAGLLEVLTKYGKACLLLNYAIGIHHDYYVTLKSPLSHRYR